MAIAIDKASLGTNGVEALATTIALTTSQAVASSGFIVLVINWEENGGGETLSSVSGGGLTWTIAAQGSPADPAFAASAIVYAQAPSGLATSTTITATFSASVWTRQIHGLSFTGVATSSPVDVTGSAVGQATATTAWTTNSLSILAGSVIVGTSYADTAAVTSTVTSPSVEAADWQIASAPTSATTAYRIETSAGSYAVAGTWSSAVKSNALGVAFKAAGGAGATVTAVPAVSAGSAPAATVSASSPTSVTGVVAASAGSAPVASLSAGATVTAPIADSVGSAPPANQIISVVIGAPAVISLGSAPSAAVSAGGTGAGVTAVPALSAGSAPAGTLSSGTTVAGAVAASVGSAPAGSISAGGTVTAAVAASTGAAPRPTIAPAPVGGAGSAQIAATFAEDAA